MLGRLTTVGHGVVKEEGTMQRQDEVQTGATVDELLARLEMMATRLAEQEAQMARVTAAMPPAPAIPVETQAKMGRRAILRRAAGATAAAALLLVAKEAPKAQAVAYVTDAGESTFNYGIAASPGEFNVFVPNLGATTHGVVGANVAPGPGLTPPISSGVFGVRSGGEFAGVLGVNDTGYGVFGLSQTGSGVFGNSDRHYGVYANSNQNTGVFAFGPQRGVWGRTGTGIGVFGQATDLGGFGVYGAAPTAAGTWAGYFDGNVFIRGGLAGGRAATSMAQGADGGLRTLYSVDSAEPVVEDFGERTLVGGKAEVAFDPEFAAVAEGAGYQVFLTPYGDCKGLAVTKREPGGFSVAELQGGTSGIGFGYRVVAKRKGATGKRLERTVAPKGLDAKDLVPATAPRPSRRPMERPGQPDNG